MLRFSRLEYLFFFCVLVCYVLYQRGFQESAPFYLESFCYITLILIELITILLVIRYNSQILAVARLNKGLLTFSLILFLSGAWSIEPYHTFLWGIHHLFTTILALYLVARYKEVEIIRLLAIGIGVLAVASILFVLIHPGAAIHWGLYEGTPWRGIYYNKNRMGIEMAIGLLAFTYSYGERVLPRWLALIGMLLTALLLWQSDSLTRQIAAAVVIPLYMVLRMMRFQFSIRLLIPLLLILVGGQLALYLVENFSDVTAMVGKDVTLSNRTRIWGYAVTSIYEHPTLGYGFNAFWIDKQRVLQNINWISATAHNHFLELFLDVGLLGGGVFLVIMFRSLIRNFKKLSKRDMFGLWPFSSILMLILVMSTDLGIHWPYALAWLLFVTSVANRPAPQSNTPYS